MNRNMGQYLSKLDLRRNPADIRGSRRPIDVLIAYHYGCRGARVADRRYRAKASSSAQEENACRGLSPQAGLPITRTAIA